MTTFQLQIILVMLMLLPVCVQAQVTRDSLVVKDTSGNIVTTHPVQRDTTNKKKDSALLNRHTPKGAAIRSAILPGWGQIYNNKWWKLPIVYTAVGIPIYLYVDNRKFYKDCNYAIAVTNSGTKNQDSLDKVNPKLRPLVDDSDVNSLLNTRNQVRKYMDYSILFTLFFWGLQVVDATVDAHLRYFDISNELSLKVKPMYFPDTKALGVGLVFNFHRKGEKF